VSLFDPFLTVVPATDVILMLEDVPFVAIDMEETLLKEGSRKLPSRFMGSQAVYGRRASTRGQQCDGNGHVYSGDGGATMTMETSQRRPRGTSPRGDFDEAKAFATASEEARLAAAKEKTKMLREARLTSETCEKASSR
jgi:hypothetical protein